jgi:hypothetical protein
MIKTGCALKECDTEIVIVLVNYGQIMTDTQKTTFNTQQVPYQGIF